MVLLNAVIECGSIAAGRLAAQADAALRTGRAPQSLALARNALRLNPWQQHAQYTAWVAQKEMRHWSGLAAQTRQARPWFADAASLWRLQGEASWMLDQPQTAAEALWRAFRVQPHPAFSATELWRMTLAAGRQAWGDADPRNRAAALSILSGVNDEPGLTAAARAQAEADARAALTASGTIAPDRP